MMDHMMRRVSVDKAMQAAKLLESVGVQLQFEDPTGAQLRTSVRSSGLEMTEEIGALLRVSQDPQLFSRFQSLYADGGSSDATTTSEAKRHQMAGLPLRQGGMFHPALMHRRFEEGKDSSGLRLGTSFGGAIGAAAGSHAGRALQALLLDRERLQAVLGPGWKIQEHRFSRPRVEDALSDRSFVFQHESGGRFSVSLAPESASQCAPTFESFLVDDRPAPAWAGPKAPRHISGERARVVFEGQRRLAAHLGGKLPHDLPVEAQPSRRVD